MMSLCKLRSEIELLVEEYYMYDTRKFIQFNLIQFVSLVQTDATLLANNSQHCWTLRVASVCTPCCALLGACCAKFVAGQIFSYVEMDSTTSNNVASVCTGL